MKLQESLNLQNLGRTEAQDEEFLPGEELLQVVRCRRRLTAAQYERKAARNYQAKMSRRRNRAA